MSGKEPCLIPCQLSAPAMHVSPSCTHGECEEFIQNVYIQTLCPDHVRSLHRPALPCRTYVQLETFYLIFASEEQDQASVHALSSSTEYYSSTEPHQY